MRRFHRLARAVAIVAAALAMSTVDAATTSDYVRDGLIACWDGVENAGAGIHDTAPAKWIDVVGNRPFSLNSVAVGADRMTFSGATTSYALLSKADTTNTFSVARDGTLEVVYAPATTSVPQFVLQSSTGSSSDKSLAFVLWQASNIIVASGTSSKKSPYFSFTSGTATNSVAVRYSGGGSVSAVGNGEALTSPGTQYYGTDASGTTVLGKRLSNALPFDGSIYCIRLYNRPLTDDEIAANQAIDAARFFEGRHGVVFGAATATLDRREATFSANLATLGGNASATVSLWIGTGSDPATFSPVGATKTVTDASAFSWDWTLPSYETPYYWQLRALGADGIPYASAVSTISVADDTLYTWSGGASGNWSDPSNWTHADVDCIGYPASTAAAASFEAGETATINFDASVSFGALVATNMDIALAFTAAPGVAVTNTHFDMGAYSVANPGQGSVRLDGVEWYSTTSTLTMQTGRSLVLDGGANLSVPALNAGQSKVHHYWPETRVSVLGGSTLATRGTLQFSGHTTLLISNATVRCDGVFYGEYVISTYRAAGGRVVFAGKHPVLTASGSACTTYGYNTYGATGADYDFLIPEGGYDEPPFQYTGAGVFMAPPNGSISRKQRFNVLAESPAVLSGEALDQPLVSLSTAMTTASLVDLRPCEGVTRTMEKSADGTAIVFRQTPSSRLLTVTAAPAELAGPDYSSYTNLAAGDALTLTCPASPTGYGYLSCGGYRLYDVAGDGTRTEVAGSPFAGTTCNYVHAGGRRELEWIWEAPVLHVSTTGDDADTGADWDHALATPQAALDRYAYATVLLAPGTYSADTTIVVTNAVTLAGCGAAPADTKLSKTANETRVLKIDNPLAVVTNLLVTNGGRQLQGGVTLSAGLLTDCSITNCNTKLNSYSGGGIAMSGGTVRRCSVVGNVAQDSGGAGRMGAGIYMTDGLVESCRILENVHSLGGNGGSGASGGGGGVYMTGGTLRNCLVARNWARVNGFGVLATGGRVENCTIADNVYDKLNSSGYGLALSGAASAMNCIVVGNANLGGEANVSCAAGARFENGCSTPAVAGFPGNVDADPRFTDAPAGDYTLGGFSKCVNGGDALAWHDGAADLAGNPRVLGPAVDMGCYERPVSATLDCSFTLSSDDGVDGASVTLDASVDGDTTGIAYYWAVTAQDGRAVTNFVTASPRVVLALGPNNYSVSLAVTNGAGSAASFAVEDAVRVLASLAYLNAAGSDVRPYATLETGAHDLAEAFEMVADGGTILVADGTYLISNRVNMVSGKGVAIRSLNGPERAVVRAVASSNFSDSALPFFRLTSSKARLEGLTIVGGRPGPYNALTFKTYNAVVVAAKGAVVTNCVVRDVHGVDRGPSGTGVYISSGTLVDVKILNCQIAMSGGSPKNGAGLYMTGGTADRVVVSNCYTTGTSTGHAQGGAVYAESATLRNSLVTACTGSWAPVAYATGTAKLDNCTIAGNRSTVPKSKSEASLYHVAGLLVDSTASVRNCIVAENRNSDLGETNLWWNAAGSATVRHTLVTGADAIGGVGNVAAPEAKFADSANGDYALRRGSPARDAGEWLGDWMDAASLDLSGQPRRFGPAVDMGCLECRKRAPTLLFAQ